MFLGGPIVSILLVRGRVDDHRRTDEMLRLRRLSNPIVAAEGAADGLTCLKLMRSTATIGEPPAPGLIVVDMDRAEADAFIAAAAAIDGIGALNLIVLDEFDAGPDLTSDLHIVRIARPASLQDLCRAAASFRRFNFEVEAVEQPNRYETKLWLCHKDDVSLQLDLTSLANENALLHE